jgi:hypothetical protein
VPLFIFCVGIHIETSSTKVVIETSSIEVVCSVHLGSLYSFYIFVDAVVYF